MKKPKFHRGTIQVITPDKKTYTVPALIYGNTGLAINQHNISNPTGRYVSVSHIPTGLRATHAFSATKHARLYCEAIAPLTNWHLVTIDNVRDLPKSVIDNLQLLRRLVVEHNDNWHIEWVKAKLVGENSKLLSANQDNI